MRTWAVLVMVGLGGCGKSAATPETVAPSSPEVGVREDAVSVPEDARVEPDAASGPSVPGEDTGDPEPPPESWRLVAPATVPPLTDTEGCVPPLDAMDGFRHAEVNGRVLTLCVASYDAKPACWTLDLDTAKIAKAKAPTGLAATLRGTPAKPSYPKGVKVRRDRKAIETCVSGKCVKLDLEGGTVGQVGVSGGRVFVAPAWDDGGSAPAVRVYDATTGARLWTETYEALESECPVFTWTGDTLYAELGVCAGPGATGAFFDGATGKRVGFLGDAQNTAAYDVVPVALPSGLFAFREQYGFGIFFHDGRGALVQRMNLSGALVKTDGDLSTSPEEGWMFAAQHGDKRELVVVNGADSRKQVVIVDPATYSITRVFVLNECPARP